MSFSCTEHTHFLSKVLSTHLKKNFRHIFAHCRIAFERQRGPPNSAASLMVSACLNFSSYVCVASCAHCACCLSLRHSCIKHYLSDLYVNKSKRTNVAVDVLPRPVRARVCLLLMFAFRSSP